jgi:hypothetical protein
LLTLLDILEGIAIEGDAPAAGLISLTNSGAALPSRRPLTLPIALPLGTLKLPGALVLFKSENLLLLLAGLSLGSAGGELVFGVGGLKLLDGGE